MASWHAPCKSEMSKHSALHTQATMSKHSAPHMRATQRKRNREHARTTQRQRHKSSSHFPPKKKLLPQWMQHGKKTCASSRLCAQKARSACVGLNKQAATALCWRGAPIITTARLTMPYLSLLPALDLPCSRKIPLLIWENLSAIYAFTTNGCTTRACTTRQKW